MPVFSVDTQAVADTAARTRTRIATIQTETDGLKGDIALLQSSWTGGAIQVQASLDLISQALDQAAVSYDDAETANTGRFGYRPGV